MAWRSHNSLIADDDEVFTLLFCFCIYLFVISFCLLSRINFGCVSLSIRVCSRRLTLALVGSHWLASARICSYQLAGITRSAHYWILCFPFWQSYFIKLFDGGLQCEFIWTFFWRQTGTTPIWSSVHLAEYWLSIVLKWGVNSEVTFSTFSPELYSKSLHSEDSHGAVFAIMRFGFIE